MGRDGMPTPVGHTVAGMIVAKGGIHIHKGLLGIVLLFSLLPDFDFLIGFAVGDPNRYHHHFTHSFLFIVFCALIAALIVSHKSSLKFKNIFVYSCFAGFAHLGMDLLAVDTSAPYGAPVFWPFSSTYFIASVQPFADVHRDSNTGTFFISLFNTHNLNTVVREIIILVPLWLGSLWIFRRKQIKK
ncbi:hypothetical protein GF406_07685 [candidate division KSB1 bacterium]|nr:hypothetical protein [candidate division KSB1 bacterium]